MQNAGRTYDEAASGSQEIVCVQSIELDTWSGAVPDVTVADNRVSGSGYVGFRAYGNVCSFSVTGNTFLSIAGLRSGC